jgi:hypothetical protein
MFKANPDGMRMEPTPERVLSVCRLVAHKSMTREEIRKAMMLGVNDEHELDQINKSINVALEELSIIKAEADKLVLTVEPDIISSAATFRRFVSKRVFADKDTTFHMFTKWVISQNERIFTMRTWEGMAATCKSESKELSALNENAVLGWRFWAAFLGVGYLSGTMIIPNMKLRLEDVLATSYAEKFKFNETILAQDFILWLSTKMPEVEFGDKLPLALSAGLRTLHELGLIELKTWSDSTPIMLYRVDGDPINSFTHITVKEAISK